MEIDTPILCAIPPPCLLSRKPDPAPARRIRLLPHLNPFRPPPPSPKVWALTSSPLTRTQQGLPS